MLSDAFFELLRAESPAGKLLDEIASQERLQDDPLFDGYTRNGAGSECEKLALLLEPRQSRDQRFAGLHGMLNAIHQLLKAQMKRNGGIVELVRLGKVVLGRFNCVGPGDNVPDCAAIVSDLNRVFGTGRLDGNIPVACFKRDFDLGFYLLFALVDAEKSRSAGMARDVDIPVGEEPVRLLRDEKNRARAVASGQFSKIVEVYGACRGAGWSRGALATF
jgi:hypothetical protein